MEVPMLLFLFACSSILLSESDSAEIVPWPECYAACETLWTPADDCSVFYEQVPVGGAVSVGACQSECALATVEPSGYPGEVWADVWPALIFEYIPDYGCESAASRAGDTPCAKTGGCVEE